VQHTGTTPGTEFRADIKLAGGLSLAVSFPTMLVGPARAATRAFRFYAEIGVPARHAQRLDRWHLIGGHLLGFVPNYILLPMLAVVLLISAVKVWRHQ
jgi:hypothetical protein